MTRLINYLCLCSLIATGSALMCKMCDQYISCANEMSELCPPYTQCYTIKNQGVGGHHRHHIGDGVKARSSAARSSLITGFLVMLVAC
ncbi:hypothetical protein GCK32_011986 [Trichostrongylus colubriformis]|uniref:Uncharacterized protein n=1 Tax=Trichostrongylus colubriformis TaxID=6319 RepID=A0AAN8G853_TRICO